MTGVQTCALPILCVYVCVCVYVCACLGVCFVCTCACVYEVPHTLTGALISPTYIFRTITVCSQLDHRDHSLVDRCCLDGKGIIYLMVYFWVLSPSLVQETYRNPVASAAAFFSEQETKCERKECERMKGECVRGRERCERKGDRERERGIESERKEERERKGHRGVDTAWHVSDTELEGCDAVTQLA